MAKMYKTTNYAQFENDPTNRNVGKIKNLMQSMSKYGFLSAYPLHVVMRRGRCVVRDGGHRLAAATALKIPVYYVICDDTEISIPEINRAQRAWSIQDYVDSNARQGNSHFVEVNRFVEEYNLPVSVCASLLLGNQAISSNANRDIKNGSFTVKNIAFAKKVAGILSALKGRGVALATNRLFAHAVSRCCLLPKFSPARFLEKAMRLESLLRAKATLDDTLEMIERIYNDHCQASEKMALKFEANKASAARDITKPNSKGKAA